MIGWKRANLAPTIECAKSEQGRIKVSQSFPALNTGQLALFLRQFDGYHPVISMHLDSEHILPIFDDFLDAQAIRTFRKFYEGSGAASAKGQACVTQIPINDYFHLSLP
jgi:hypothetical protein